jgi:hypothetical protein
MKSCASHYVIYVNCYKNDSYRYLQIKAAFATLVSQLLETP